MKTIKGLHKDLAMFIGKLFNKGNTGNNLNAQNNEFAN